MKKIFKKIFLFFIPEKNKKIRYEFNTPFTLEVLNTSQKLKQKVSVLKNIDAEIIVNSSTPCLHVEEFFNLVISKGIKCEKIMIYSRIQDNLVEGFSLLCNNSKKKHINFFIDPYASAFNFINNKEPFHLDFNSDIIINSFEPNSKILISIEIDKQPILRTNFQKFVYWLKK